VSIFSGGSNLFGLDNFKFSLASFTGLLGFADLGGKICKIIKPIFSVILRYMRNALSWL